MFPFGTDFSMDGFPSNASFHGQSWNFTALHDNTAITPPAEEALDSYFQKNEASSFSPVTDDEVPLVAIIGVGYVGLHLVTAFSKHYNVVAFDISQKRLAAVADQLPKTGNLTLTSDKSRLAAATHFLVSVPTLLVPGTSVVDTSLLRMALDTISARARVGSTIVIESSVAVGMTRSLLGNMVQERHLKAGMSPERVDPGRISPSFEDIPKLISGLDDLAPGSLRSIQQLYAPIFKTLVPVSCPEVAEMTKLYENCQRMLCIAYANEMADACAALTAPIDPFEVSRAAATKPFGYLPFSPSAGVGGHCIPVNPHYLFSTSEFPQLRHATERMAARPAAIADRTMKKLHLSGKFTKGKPQVLVVGVAFKAGQSVLSHSPGVKIINHLLDLWEAHVTFADPLVEEEAVPQVPKLDVEREWNDEGLRGFDAVIVVIKQLLDEYADLQKPIDGTTGCTAACMALKRRKPSLKVLLSIGGGSGSQHFAALASKPALQERFAQAAALLVRSHGFDGVDLDWEHPSSPAQGTDFVSLVQAIRRHLPTPQHLLTTALSVGEYVLKHIDLRLLAHSLSFLNLMAYDFAGAWSDGHSGHHAQLTAPANPHNSFARKSGAGAVEYVIERGVPKGKIILGIPVYGRSFLGVRGPGERFSECGGAGGTWLYSELPRPGTVQRVDWEVGGAYCEGEEEGDGEGEWVSYESVETVRMKAEFVRRVGIGGLFYWTGVGDKKGEESLVAAGWRGLCGI